MNFESFVVVIILFTLKLMFMRCENLLRVSGRYQAMIRSLLFNESSLIGIVVYDKVKKKKMFSLFKLGIEPRYGT